MFTRKELLDRALICSALAERLSDPGQKRMLLKMAQDWRRVAQEVLDGNLAPRRDVLLKKGTLVPN